MKAVGDLLGRREPGTQFIFLRYSCGHPCALLSRAGRFFFRKIERNRCIEHYAKFFQLKVNDIPASGMPFFRDSIVSAWDLCAYENYSANSARPFRIVSAWDLCAYENAEDERCAGLFIVSAWNLCAYENSWYLIHCVMSIVSAWDLCAYENSTIAGPAVRERRPSPRRAQLTFRTYPPRAETCSRGVENPARL